MSNQGETLFHSSKQHISEETMLAFLDGELSALQARRVKKHLSSCWLCRSRRAEYERTIQLFMEYRGEILAAARYGENDGKERFLATLDSYIERNRFSVGRRIWAAMRRAWYAGSRPSVLCATAAVSLVLAVLLLFSGRRFKFCWLSINCMPTVVSAFRCFVSRRNFWCAGSSIRWSASGRWSRGCTRLLMLKLRS